MPDPEQLKILARREEAAGNLERAGDLYRRALEAQQTARQGAGPEPGLLVRVGDLAHRTGNREDALSTYQRAAEAYVEQGLLDNAVAVYDKVLRLYPDRRHGHRRLAFLHLEQGLKAEARKEMRRYAARAEEAGRRDELISALQAYVERDPDEDLRFRLVDLLREEERLEEAMDLLDQMWEERSPEFAGGEALAEAGEAPGPPRREPPEAAPPPSEPPPGPPEPGPSAPEPSEPEPSAPEPPPGPPEPGPPEPESSEPEPSEPGPPTRPAAADEPSVPRAPEPEPGPPETGSPPPASAAPPPGPSPPGNEARPMDDPPRSAPRTAAERSRHQADEQELRRGLTVLEELRELAPDDPDLLRRQAAYGRRLDDPEVVVRALLDLAELLEDRGSWRAAALLCREVLLRAPDDQEARRRLASLESARRAALRGRLGRAARPAEEASSPSTGPAGGDALGERLAAELEAWEDALPWLHAVTDAASAEDGGDDLPSGVVAEALGRYLMARRRPEEAEAVLSEAESALPLSPVEETRIVYWLGRAHEAMGREEAARSCYDRVAADEPAFEAVLREDP